jgi:hypothetical protein
MWTAFLDSDWTTDLGSNPVGGEMQKWLSTVSVLLVIGGLVLTAASETVGNIVVLVGGLAQVWVGLALWTNPSLSSGLGHPRVWAAVFLVVGASFVVESAITLA